MRKFTVRVTKQNSCRLT